MINRKVNHLGWVTSWLMYDVSFFRNKNQFFPLRFQLGSRIECLWAGLGKLNLCLDMSSQDGFPRLHLRKQLCATRFQQWDVGVCEWDFEPDPFLAVGF